MLSFGVTFMADPPVSEIVGRTVLAEENGFSHAWLWDSHVLWQEVYPVFTLMAAATQRDPHRAVRHQPGHQGSDGHGEPPWPR